MRVVVGLASTTVELERDSAAPGGKLSHNGVNVHALTVDEDAEDDDEHDD